MTFKNENISRLRDWLGFEYELDSNGKEIC
jgi:hypothetical protein